MTILGAPMKIFSSRFGTIIKNLINKDPRDALIVSTIIGISVMPIYIGYCIYKDPEHIRQRSNESYWEKLKEEHSNFDW